MSSSRRTSINNKRSADVALPAQESREVIVLDEAGAGAGTGAGVGVATSAPVLSSDPLQVAPGGAIPASKAAEESTSHKAKRLATEAGHSVQVAVTQGLEAASDALHAVQAKLSGEPTVAKAPYDMSAEGKNAEPSTLEKGKAALSHAAEVVATSTKQAYDAITAKSESSGVTEKVKSGASSVAAGINATAHQISTALSGSTGSEVSRGAARDESMVDASKVLQRQAASAAIGDDPHAKEKEDGSLPCERTNDEFPHARTVLHETFEDCQLGGPGQPSTATVVEVTKMVDVPLDSKKDDSTTLSGSNSGTKTNTQPDLLTGDNLRV